MPGFANDTVPNSIMWTDNVDFSGAVIPTATVTANGQLLIGSAIAPQIRVGRITSPGGTILIGYNSPNITLDLSGSAVAVEHLTGNTGGQLNPTANNFNILGNGVSGSGTSTVGNIFITGAGSTLTVNNTQAQFMTNYTTTNHAASPYVVLATDNYIAVDPAAGTVQLNFPNAPTTNRIWTVKDKTGNASTSNISITTVGGSVTIDGQTIYKITSNYGSVNLLFNGTSYEVW